MILSLHTVSLFNMDTVKRQLQLYEEVLNFYFNEEHQARL